MDETSLLRLEKLILAHTGLQLRRHEREELCATLKDRMAALHLHHADEYNQLLQGDTPESTSEWEQLSALLTNNESYFFRDKGQMSLLRERILPELIANNQARRTLRLWSAGCSTGEEAYSLAILVDELLPHRGTATGARWNIAILGTDIDGQALQRAQRGIYGSWSFRTVEPGLQQRYFHRREDGWQVTEASRSLVTFSRCNLVGDKFPNTALGLYDMDLILCRNVFIYFERDAVTAVMSKFAQTLRAGGYLMTGHTETYGGLTASLQARMFPESMVYQRADVKLGAVGTPIGLHTTPSVLSVERAALSRRTNPIVEAPKLTPASAHPIPVPATPPPPAGKPRSVAPATEFRSSSGEKASPVSTPQPPSEPDAQRLLLLQAQNQANQGHYEEATRACERLMREYPSAPEAYELLASIAQEQGNNEEAKVWLKKALYLAPASPSAYLELGALYQREGDTMRARKMYGTSLELLSQISPEATVGLPGSPTAQEWIPYMKQLLAELAEGE